MPGTFSSPMGVSDPDMQHGTCVTHVPCCMSGSLTSSFLWSRWRGKRSRHSRQPAILRIWQEAYAHSFCCALFHCSCIISFDGSMWWIRPYPQLSADSRVWLANNRKEWICTSRLTSSTWCIPRVTSLMTSEWRSRPRGRLLWRSDMIIFRCWQDLFLFSIKEHMMNKGSYSHLGQ